MKLGKMNTEELRMNNESTNSTTEDSTIEVAQKVVGEERNKMFNTIMKED